VRKMELLRVDDLYPVKVSSDSSGSGFSISPDVRAGEFGRIGTHASVDLRDRVLKDSFLRFYLIEPHKSFKPFLG